MIDRFLTLAARVQVDGPLGTDAQKALDVEVKAFIAAGGVLTLRDWLELGDESRAAFIRVRHELLAMPEADPVSPEKP